MTFEDFILAHKDDDPAALALQRDRLRAEVDDWDLALSTLEARGKLRGKVPEWYAAASLRYPRPLSAEQCSSTETAAYKVYCLKDRRCGIFKTMPPTAYEWEGPIYGRDEDRRSEGFENSTPPVKMIADLTGGLGVDSWAFSKAAERVLYNEMDSELSKAAEYNFKQLGINNIEVRNSKVEPGAVQRILGEFRPDLIFMDPARRAEGRKVFLLEDCSPNVKELLPELYEACPRLMFKLSPMADITAVCRQLPGVKEVHVVAAGGECKELLLLLEKGYSESPAVYAFENGSVMRVDLVQNGPGPGPKTATGDMEGLLLFEPGKALLKAGAFDLPCRFGFTKLSADTHLYTASATVPELGPFGKWFRIEKAVPLTSKALKTIGPEISEADVTARGIPMSSDELRHRLKLKPSTDGTRHLFGVKTDGSGNLLILCRKISLSLQNEDSPIK